MSTKVSKVSFDVLEGTATALGSTVQKGGVNFAVYSSSATQVNLLLFEDSTNNAPIAVLPMNKTDDVWHLFVKDIGVGSLYLFSMDGPNLPSEGHRFNKEMALIDPHCQMLTNATDWHAPFDLSVDDSKGPTPKCVVVGESEFDWQDDKSPQTPLCESVIYEVHLRGFTGHDNSPVLKHKGTYRGFIEMIPYLKKLGITAVEFLPMMEWYRPTEFKNPDTGEPNRNDWGYDTLAHMAPDEALATQRLAQVDEFKLLVRELHKAGIEVILDIVLNHTGESDQSGPTISFRGLDNKTYYLLKPDNLAEYTNFTGCGNTVNCNHPVVRSYILDVLRHWVEEYHVDGFRFDLCAVFGIDVDASVKPDTPLLKEIVSCPVLSKVKLIAEPWAIGAYLMGQFPEPFAEWSDRFRDTVRSFVRGEAGYASALAKVVSGSTDMFGENGSRLPVNFVTAHDGFTLMDLVSYEEKHNRANGEENRDGSSHNRSWNCGYEGDLESSDLGEEDIARIAKLRKQQIRNFITLMMVSRGAPMILYGDELGRTNYGNNNTWNQAELNSLDWSLLLKNQDILTFVGNMIAFRKKHLLGGRGGETPEFRSVVHHGIEPFNPDHSDGARFVAWQLEPFEDGSGQSIYCATNGYWEDVEVTLPQGKWKLVVDTSDPEKVGCDEYSICNTSNSVTLKPRSTLVLVRE